MSFPAVCEAVLRVPHINQKREATAAPRHSSQQQEGGGVHSIHCHVCPGGTHSKRLSLASQPSYTQPQNFWDPKPLNNIPG